MSMRFFVIILVTLGVLGGAFWFTGQKTNGPGSSSAQPTNHVLSGETGQVVLIEYGDFQCPACGGYYPMLKEVKEFLGDKLAFQFRNFPIVQIHPNAMAAHRAAEAANNQGKFWEMHDMLYERQQLWTSSQNPVPVFETYAQELGLDMTRYRQDTASEVTLNIISADVKEGQKIGATATPTFVLDGKKIDENPRSVEEFVKLIEDAIAAKNGN